MSGGSSDRKARLRGCIKARKRQPVSRCLCALFEESRPRVMAFSSRQRSSLWMPGDPAEPASQVRAHRLLCKRRGVRQSTGK